MSGRGAGYCAGYPAPGFMNSAWGRGGWGSGRGGGGWRHRNWYHATGASAWQRTAAGQPGYAPPASADGGPPMTREQELAGLREQAKGLEKTLDALQARISELASSAEGSKAE